MSQPSAPQQQAACETRIRQAVASRTTSLTLSGLNLKDLPNSITQLTWLQELDISNNQLTEIPEKIRQLTRLQKLQVVRNNISEIPEWIGELESFESLYAAGNQIAHLPESLTQLKNLKELYVGMNRLSQIPTWLSKLVSLEALGWNNNGLTELPEFISQLTHLKVLLLGGNKLTSLPERIGQLSQLEELDLEENRLKNLPASLKRLKNLVGLFLHKNKALRLPSELMGSRWNEDFESRARPALILNYYFHTQRSRGLLNEAKLILVGRGGAGKTSLVNRLLRDQFRPGESKTEGIQISSWSVRLKKTYIQLNIWDFGGQEIMHATHQFFLTQRSLYLLVLSGREGTEDQDADYWLRMIESFGAESPVIVVLNKIQEHKFDVNRRALQAKHPSIRGFVSADCLDRTGIDELRKLILRETDQLEDLRAMFPASWFEIKAKLSASRKNYLSYSDFRKLCQKHGEKNPEAQELLAGYLHQLGIALNYRDDPRLQDTHVLNPHWVTNGIYKLLNSPILTEQHGVLRLTDMARVLDSKKYPASMHRFLLDLMKKFELCFTFPDNNERYLIPELLDKQEPPEAAEFPPEECLNFQYHYPVLPEGLLPRFIVRTHALSEQLPRWRTGTILQFEGNRALVKADPSEKKVFILIKGPVSSRRRLLAIIRSDFEHIHRDIPKLEPKEMVPVPQHPEAVIPYSALKVFEEDNEPDFKMVIRGRVANISVQALLDGVDLPTTATDGNIKSGKIRYYNKSAVHLFYSYSHKDEALRTKLETHLKLLKRQGLLSAWHDRMIEPSDEWKKAISEQLNRADVILLLISADFLNTDFCYDVEMMEALKRHDAGEAVVIPVILRDVSWHKAPFAKLQALPKDGLAVTMWPNEDSAWRNVSEGIERAIEAIQQRRQRR